MSAARVTSEIGRLRTVLVHAPGAEIDRMVPNMMEQLLFDDILFGEQGGFSSAKALELWLFAGARTCEEKRAGPHYFLLPYRSQAKARIANRKTSCSLVR